MKLELYLMETCPFCRKVMNEISASGRTDVTTRDIIKDPDSHAALIQFGGKDQVPCLFIDGSPLYESDDIIAWLRANPQG